jgi:integrase
VDARAVDYGLIRALYPGFAADLRLEGRLGRSRATYLSYVRRFVALAMERRGGDPPASFTRQDVDEFLRRMEERAVAIGATKLVPDAAVAVKSFLRRALGPEEAERLLPSGELRRIAEDWARRRANMPGRTPRPMYTWAEAARVFRAAVRLDAENTSPRLAHIYTCVIGLCLYAGMRPAEIRRLRRSNFSPDFSSVTYWPAKRGSLVEREIPDPRVREALRLRFQALEARGYRPEWDPPLLPGRGCRKSLASGGPPRFIGHATAWRIAKRAAEAAGVDSTGKPFYGFRRREVTTLLEEGLPGVVVQKLKGWKSPQMILYYHKTPMREMAAQAARIIAGRAAARG